MTSSALLPSPLQQVFCILVLGFMPLSTALAAAPDTVVIKARKGNITFPHRMHEEAGLLKNCTDCHADHQGDKLGKQGMSRGHAICRTCHTEMQAGPRLCDDCHK